MPSLIPTYCGARARLGTICVFTRLEDATPFKSPRTPIIMALNPTITNTDALVTQNTHESIENFTRGIVIVGDHQPSPAIGMKITMRKLSP